MALQQRRGGLLSVAGGVAGLTLVSRILGFLRWLVQAATVGTGTVAGAYTTANQLPNTLYEVVVGGVLAATVVPLLAAPIAAGSHRTARTRCVSIHDHSRLDPMPSAAATGTSRTSPRTVPDDGPGEATSKVGRPRECSQETSVAMTHTGTATTAPRRRIPVTMTSSTA